MASSSGVSAVGSVAIGNYGDIPFPPAPCGNIMRKYDILKKQRQKEYMILQENETSDPEVATTFKEILEKDWNEILQAAGEIDCPFCCLSLPARDVVDEGKWKLHVKNDLDSYVCLFEGCESPQEMYSNSSTWLKHMSSHYMRWRCVSKSHAEFQSATKSEYVNHMKAVHPGKFTDAQLNILAIRNARPTSSMFKPCPLCGNKEFDGNRADHVAGHLLLLALKSLPSYEEHIEENKELVLYQQPHLLISNTLSKSSVGQDSRNDSNFIVSTGRTQSSSVPKNEETTIRGSTGGQQHHKRNEAIVKELQQWQERLNSQQSSSSTVYNSQQAATTSPILEEQPAFQADLSPSYSKVEDDDIPIEYGGSKTTVKHAYFSPSSPVLRSLDDPTEKHDSGRKGKEKGEEEEDGDIEMDDVKLSLSSLPEYSSQKHVVFMDKATEKWGERKEDGNTTAEEINHNAPRKASYHEQVVGKEDWQQGNAETSSDFHAHGRTPIIDMTRDTEDPSEIFVCDLCNRRFHHYEHLKRHFRALHTLADLFECNECGKKFSLRENFAQHARSHAADEIVIDDASGVPNYGKVLFQIASEIPGSDSELSPEEGTRSKGTEKRKRSH